MSVELLLLPLAMAGFSTLASGFSAVEAMRTDNKRRRLCMVETRLKDPELLVQAFANLRAEATAHADDTVEATWEGVEIRFSRNDDGSLVSQFQGADVDTARAEEIVRAVDAEYARLVQQRVHQRVKERAADLGMTVESETVDQERAITVVLNVER